MGNWLIDQTDLYAIQYDLLREARVGDAVLGILGLGEAGQYTSLIAGGLVTGWLPDVKEVPNLGLMTRTFSVLMLSPVTVLICRQAAAFQMAGMIYKKESEVPYDNASTPAKWTWQVSYVGETKGAIAL